MQVARTVALVLPEDVIALDFAVPLQMFGPWPDVVADRAGVQSGYELLVVSSAPDLPSLLGFHGPVQPLSVAQTADMVVVPGVADPSVEADPELISMLQEASKRGAAIASICTGAFVLAAAGLLSGRRVTTHWAWAPDLRREYPDVHVQEQHLFLGDGGVYTSGGVLSGMDLCLHLIGRDFGREVANSVARFVVSPPHRAGGQQPYIDRPLGARDGQLVPAFDYLERNLDGAITLEAAAMASHMSARTLTRRFKVATGMTLFDWVAKRRVQEARRLLEATELSVLQISHQVGFGSAESMRLRFIEDVGCNPSQYRQTFG